MSETAVDMAGRRDRSAMARMDISVPALAANTIEAGTSRVLRTSWPRESWAAAAAASANNLEEAFAF